MRRKKASAKHAALLLIPRAPGVCHYKIEKIADLYFAEPSHRKFLNHTHVYQICDSLNLFFTDLYQSVRDLEEKAKSFRRTPLENRRRLMQYACHLMGGEPQTIVVHLTIRRDIKVIGGDQLRIDRRRQ